LDAYVYVDGFNLYYGCLKGTAFRWLDLNKLCSFLLPNAQVKHIHYFTARVSARPNDPQQPVRQETYLRALQTLPNVSLTFGRYLTKPTRMALSNPPKGAPQTVEVIKTEEKGSDVNIATQMLVDGFQSKYDLAVVISNDSDLMSPVQAVRNVLGLPVGILNPYKHPARDLLSAATFIKPIRQGVLAASQFPNTLTDSNGTFTRPLGW
jgi:hypothetical protein